MRKLSKPISVLLSLIMAFSVFGIVPITAQALDAISFIDKNGDAQSTDTYTEVTSGTTGRTERSAASRRRTA